MKIAHLSDAHFTSYTLWLWQLIGKRSLGMLNWFFTRRSTFQTEHLNQLPQLFSSLGVDLILFSGDFTTTALHQEYQLARNWMDGFSQPLFAVPGNHDHYTYFSDWTKRFYRYFQNPLGLFSYQLNRHGIEVHALQEPYYLVLLDTSRATNPYSSRGFFTKTHAEHLKGALEKIPKRANILVVNHYPLFVNDAERRSLVGHEMLQQILQEDLRIRIYLQGHSHRHTIADLQPSYFPLILDAGCCSKAVKGTWNLIELMQDQCHVDAYHWNQRWEVFQQERIVWTR